MRRDEPDVLVIGGGRAGLCAAIAAAGAEGGVRIVVLEAEAVVDEAGLVAEARSRGVEVRAGSAATGWYAGMLTAIDDEAIWELRPRAVVAATGSYELVPTVPGSDRPGVMSARLALQLLARHGLLPGERALLVGAGEELAAAGAALRDAGADIVGPIPTGALRSVGGRGQVAWARYVEAGAAAAERRERVEVVIFGDRTPNLDLVLAAGGRVDWHHDRLAPASDPDGRSSVPGLFVAGDAAGLSVDAAAMETQARRAGAAAGSFARTASEGRPGFAGERARARRPRPAPRTPPQSGPGTRPGAGAGPPAPPGSDQAVLCFCEDVRGWEVRAELVAGYADPELIKRRTGALTGPCQGKYCLSAIACAIAGGEGVAAPASGTSATPDGVHLPTGRPPLRPVRLRDLIVEEASSTTADADHG